MAENVTKTGRVRRPVAGATTAVRSTTTVPVAGEPPAPKPDARPKPAPPKAPAPKPTASPPPAASIKPARRPTSGRPGGAVATLVVRVDERPWTPGELAEVRAELDAEVVRHEGEITEAERDLAELLRDSGEGAGEDQADSGTKTFEREHEMSLANNSRHMLLQSSHARARMDDGTYGICEACNQPIGKARLQAFPRATLCMTCKQREERR
jgi:DnaK suppressor protein